MATCCIALGGNLGNTAELFEDALERLRDADVHATNVSHVMRSTPMGADAGQEFMNACAVVETQLAPIALLQLMHEVETSLGRRRTTHWGPRTIDLDLLLYNQQVIDAPDIVVPHPAMWYRRFVLEPLAEIAPGMRHPVLDQTIAELFARLRQRPLCIAVGGVIAEAVSLQRLQAELQKQFGEYSVKIVNDQKSDPVLFATIRVDAGKQPTERSQPKQEPDRTLRVFAKESSAAEQLLCVLQDLCTAAIG